MSPRGMCLWDTFLLDHELSDWAEGDLPSLSQKQWAFSLQTYPRVRFYQLSMKETTFC